MAGCHYQHCPACNSGSIAPVFAVQDHSVSKENFEIWECSSCGLRFTQDVPDENSIGRYYQSSQYISHSNTKTGIVNKLYHLVRNFTLLQKKRLIIQETGIKKGNLLDIGAGVGTFAAFMKNAGWSVTGLEPDANTRSNAMTQYGIALKPTDELFQQMPQSYNAITMWHVLEHVHNLHGYLSQLRKLLKPGGVLFIAVPNYTSGDAGKYQSYWAAYDVPIHLYHFSPGSMKKLLESHGFKLKSIQPMWFDSFYVSLLSEKYRTGKQQLFQGFFSGLQSNLNSVVDKEKCSSLIYVVE
ncbi:MAG: class I SAM-dependent methyltransferase [Chitinophagaceae bacterium]|nr:MAG: class I SAM-dependent methyltransferase [Chitinophagaceae bacterium]